VATLVAAFVLIVRVVASAVSKLVEAV
jgi:hypothetical protein